MKRYIIFLIIILANFLFTVSLSAKEYDMSAEALFSFGEAFFKQGRYAEARHEFQKCLMLNPGHDRARKGVELCDTEMAREKEELLSALENPEEKSEAKIETPVIIPAQEETPPALAEPLKTAEEKELPLIETEEIAEESLIPPLQKGAWTLKKGEIYVELYSKYFWHNHQFTNARKEERWGFEGKGDELSTELKLEYGINDTNTLLLSTVAKEAHWKDSFTSNTKKGFTEIKPGIKHLLFTRPFICSAQLKVKFPLDYSEEAVPALSTHQIDGEMKILTAQPWPKLPGYTKFESGFIIRAEERSNEIPYFFELGYNLKSNVILKATLDGKTAVGGGIHEDFLKYTLGPILKIKDLFNIELGFGHTFAGRNTSAAKEIFTTLSRQW